MLLTVFFDIQGPLFVEFLGHRGTITSDVYWETLQSLRKSIKNERQELLTERVVLHPDNTRSHTSKVTQAKRAKFQREQLDHLLYSSDMSPCDFHVLVLLKKKTSERSEIQLRDELKDAVKD